MTIVRSGFLAVLLALALIGAAPAASSAASHTTEREQAEQMALEAMEQLMRALELFIQSIPQYEAPEITDDGDIIIRRKRRQEQKTPGQPELDETRA